MNINEMLKNAKRLQAQVEKEEKEIAGMEFVVEKQGIKVVMNGNRKIKSIEINEALIDPDDPELIQDLVMIAVNEAIEVVDQKYEELNSKFSNSGMPF
ncbi:YbaB/EbfC family nucleoid-associated protein [Metamycoplasma spumans]|uniref:YbaB/EbfC family nucleoid-associated protein n=1 Tax=Metamycoplasma spumans TaxID=92406 RepID=UPI0034DD7BAD